MRISAARTIANQDLIFGDCVKAMAKMEVGSVDVAVTSPPYNLNLAYGSYDDAQEEPDYLNWLVKVCLAVKRMLKPDGSFFLNIAGSSSRPWLPFELIVRLREAFVLQNHIVWVKSIGIGSTSTGHFKPIAGRRFTHHNHEHVFHLTVDGRVDLDRLSIGVPFADKSNIARRGHARDLRCRGNTWFIPYETVKSRAQKFRHPGTFPVELPLWCIYLHGKRRPVVLDPFVGSGTTLVAVHLAGGHGIGIDIDPTYLSTAHDRVAAMAEGAIRTVLTVEEMQALQGPEPQTGNDGGWQSLLVRLNNRLNRTTGEITLSAQELEKMRRYAFQHGNGAWHGHLITVFGRSLGSDLGSRPQGSNPAAA